MLLKLCKSGSDFNNINWKLHSASNKYKITLNWEEQFLQVTVYYVDNCVAENAIDCVSCRQSAICC